MSKPTKAIIFNKYQIKKLIASSHFGLVYEGINIRDKEPIAMKFEKKSSKYKLLESEAYILFTLKGFGIPKLITYGKSGLFNVLIEELLGLSIYEIWNTQRNNQKYKIKDVCMLAIQIIDRLEYIHSKDIIHRDIKPMNVTIGKEQQNLIYLIDFGFAHKFRSTKTGKHIRFKNIKKVFGSMRYLSINANKGYEQSRRDDLESLAYTLIHLARNNLPWVYIENQDIKKMKKYKLVCESKINTSPVVLCSGIHENFAKFLTYVRNLEFEQEPDYDYMRNLFLEVLSRYHYNNDLMFSWISNKKIKAGLDIKSLDNKSYNRKNSLTKNNRKNSKQKLYNKIKNSLEIGRSKSQDNTDTHNILNLENFQENHNNKLIRNMIPVFKKIKSISPQKEINSIKNKNLIYHRKKIQKIIIKDNKNDIILPIKNENKFENNDDINYNPEKSKTININILKNKNLDDSKLVLQHKRYNSKKIIDLSHLIKKNKFSRNNNSNDSIFGKIREKTNGMEKYKIEMELNSFRLISPYKYKALKERKNSYNTERNMNYINNNINEIENQVKEIPIRINIKKRSSINKNIQNKPNQIKINNKHINTFSSNNIKSPQNYNKANITKKLNLRGISYNNDENTYSMNNIGEVGLRKRNHLINFNLSFDQVKYNPNIKIKNNCNISNNHKKVNSFNNIIYNDTRTYTFKNNNYNIKCFNYIPLAIKKVKGNFNIDSL